MSVMPRALRAAMLEMVDMGATWRSSKTVYITASFTNPTPARSETEAAAVSVSPPPEQPTSSMGTLIAPRQWRHGVLLTAAT